ncbi:hypothetical protein SRHO_G00330990 [Serrasalmus rhombeus]
MQRSEGFDSHSVPSHILLEKVRETLSDRSIISHSISAHYRQPSRAELHVTQQLTKRIPKSLCVFQQLTLCGCSPAVLMRPEAARVFGLGLHQMDKTLDSK